MSTKPPAPARRAIFCFSVLLVGATGIASAQDANITDANSIRQDQLVPPTYTVNQVLQSGRQFFASPMLPVDGHGEGDFVTGDPGDGDRADQRAAMWAGSTPQPHYIPFLRVDGIDSQSCFECHNSAGTYVPQGQIARTQKPGGVGGSGGFSVSLLQNMNFPNPLSKFVRSPPRAFGSAYLQELGLEMTADLLQIEQLAIAEAAENPTHPHSVRKPLNSKGVDFGFITITCQDATCLPPKRDTHEVVGVQADLIVRPFQHKGIAATLRSFVKTALNFHQSMQPVEDFPVDSDCDNDGVVNEMAVQNDAVGDRTTSVQQSLGNVVALTAFTGMLRPPNQEARFSDSGGTVGRNLFTSTGCEGCHRSSLKTRPDPQFRIQFAAASDNPTCPDNNRLGSGAEANAPVHPAVRMATAFSGSECTDGSTYCIDLTDPVLGPADPLPADFYPRLAANPRDDTVSVPLFSDLKRHRMGCFLLQNGTPQTDDSDNPIRNDEWLTSKVWGVAANGPWLHDGRARTLREAILMHNGTDGTGSPATCALAPGDVTGPHPSEAAGSVANFIALTETNKQALVDFLETLTIPVPGG